MDLLVAGPTPGAVRIGLALPLSGPLALTAPSALDLAEPAAEECTAAGWAGDQRLELVAIDSGRAPAVVAAEVTALQSAGALAGLVGLHTSDVHRAVERAWQGRGTYVFTPPHEGGRSRPGVRRLRPPSCGGVNT